MTATVFKSRAWPWVWVLVLSVLAFSLASALTASQNYHFRASQSVVSTLLSEARSVVGGNFYMQADLFLHLGIPHIEDKAFSNDVFQILLADISPMTHLHAVGKDVEEILPWLRWATEVDPDNIEAQMVLSFWLYATGYPSQAEQVLREAQQSHPRDYRIQLQKGLLFMKEKKYGQARNAFDAGLRLWPSKGDLNDREVRLDKAAMLEFRGFLREADRDIHGAIKDFESILQMFPDREGIKPRVETLKSGGKPSVLAEQIWRDMLDSQKHVFRDECKDHADDRRHGPHD